MTVKRTPLLLFVGFWVTLLLVGLLGSATAPSVALADGMTGDTLPAEGNDTTGGIDQHGGGNDTNPNEPSTLDLIIGLLQVLL